MSRVKEMRIVRMTSYFEYVDVGFYKEIWCYPWGKDKLVTKWSLNTKQKKLCSRKIHKKDW